MTKAIIALAMLLAFCIDYAFAHGGGCLKADKEASGQCCHVESATGEKHCH